MRVIRSFSISAWRNRVVNIDVRPTTYTEGFVPRRPRLTARETKATRFTSSRE